MRVYVAVHTYRYVFTLHFVMPVIRLRKEICIFHGEMVDERWGDCHGHADIDMYVYILMDVFIMKGKTRVVL